VAYALGALWVLAAAIIVLGALWLLRHRLGWLWATWPVVLLLVAAAVAGTWLALNPILLLVGLTAALSAWNLDHFVRQLGEVDAVEQERTLKHLHLRRLLIVDGLGLLLAVLALTIRIRLSFGVALTLGLIALLGLSRAIRFLRRERGTGHNVGC
jgi:hypothetical protein